MSIERSGVSQPLPRPLALAALVLSYGRMDLTARCVASLGEPIRKIYIVDNSCDAQALAQLRLQLGEDTTCHPPVRMLTPPTNLGFARGIQFGLDRARMEQAWDAYWIMNNDASATPDLISRMVETFEANGRNALVAPLASMRGGVSRLWYHRLFGLVLSRPAWGAFPYLNGACILVPASCTTPHLFDPDFFLYGEDVELSWRASRLGFPLIEVDARYRHEGNAASQNGSLFYEYHIVRGHLLLAVKLADHRYERWLFYMGRALSLPIRATIRSLRKRSLTPWRGLVAAAFHLARPLDPPPVSPGSTR